MALRLTLVDGEVLRLISVIVACAILLSCAQQPSRAVPAREASAIDANRRGDASFNRGEYEDALRFYREALRIAQSLEDVEGIASNAINVSIVYQRLGRSVDARQSLAPVIDSKTLVFTEARRAAAALRLAILDLDDRKLVGATEWSDRAATWCMRGNCGIADAIDNVRARIALETGNIPIAVVLAGAALQVSRTTENRVETANALRLLGDAAIRSADAKSAIASLSEALAIDRDLASPRKIWLDLVALGRASVLAVDAESARRYYQRALAVSEAERDTEGAAVTTALIDALGQRK